jgi:hypothetical protein
VRLGVIGSYSDGALATRASFFKLSKHAMYSARETPGLGVAWIGITDPLQQLQGLGGPVLL